MADIVLKDRNGTDIEYPGINAIRMNTVDGETVTFVSGKTSEKTVSADFSEGNMEIATNDGTFLEKVTVEKPDTLTAENIRSGVTVAGVEGDFIGDTEETTVDLAMADGDQVISPSESGKVISQVTITKPDTLIPENILDGVDIGGVVGSVSIPESEEANVTLDFSGGDMAISPDDGKAFSAVNIAKPETLLAENIAEGIDIAGIIGTLAAGGGGSGDFPCMFIKPSITYTRYSGKASGTTQTNTIELPLNSTVHAFISESRSHGSSSTTVCPTGTISGAIQYSCAVEQGSDAMTVSYTENITRTSSYTIGVSYAIVLFSVPGIYHRVDEDGTYCIYADSTATVFPSNAAVPAKCSTKVDLSNSTISVIPKYAFFSTAVSEILLPGTITEIGNFGLYGCKIIDFSKHTTIPTVDTSSIPSSVEIRVPQALYDDWIAADIWSTSAANIVPV